MGFLKKMCFLRNKVIVLEIAILKKMSDSNLFLPTIECTNYKKA